MPSYFFLGFELACKLSAFQDSQIWIQCFQNTLKVAHSTRQLSSVAMLLGKLGMIM